MREHNTVLLDDKKEFDSYVNSYANEGWDVDSKMGGSTPDGYFFMAFLSREVPSSPPPVKIGEFPEGEVPVLMPKSTYDDLKAKADAYETYGPDLPRLYTYDEAWLIWEEGRDKWELSDKNGDSEAHFEKFLESLGKNPPAPEIGENTPTERPSNELIRKVAGDALSYGYKQGQIDSEERKSYDVNDVFRPWWERYELPADPLEADRELVSPYLQYIDWTSPIMAVDGDDSDLNELPGRLDASLRKLCGKGGESNG